MFAGVADTHTVLWYLFADPKLSSVAKTFIDKAGRSDRYIGLSAISLAEIVYLVEKGRIRPTAYSDIRRALGSPEHVFREVPLHIGIIDRMHTVSRAEIPDMPDRIIAATAVHLGVPVISRDGRIRGAAVQSIW